MLGPLGQRLAKFSAQLYNLFEMMVNSKILENNHQRPFRGSFYVWKWRAWTYYKNFIYQKPVYLQELKLNPFPYLSSVYIFQIIEIFPSLFCHCLFIGLIRNPLDLSCTRPGREYSSRHLTDAVRVFQGEHKYSGDLPEDEFSFNCVFQWWVLSDKVHPLLFCLIVTCSCASTQLFHVLRVTSQYSMSYHFGEESTEWLEVKLQISYA